MNEFIVTFIKAKDWKQCEYPLIEDVPVKKNETTLYELIGKAL